MKRWASVKSFWSITSVDFLSSAVHGYFDSVLNICKILSIWISCVVHEAVGSPSRINDVKKRTSFLEYIY